MINKITEDNVDRVIGKAVREALEKAAEELGMKVSHIRGRFTESNIKYTGEAIRRLLGRPEPRLSVEML